MSKLYPPYIEGTIPAFCDTKEGTVLTVPFSMNRAVNKKEVVGFYLKLKTIQSDKYLITRGPEYCKYDLEKQEVYIDLTDVKDKLNIGQFYKIQIAYVSSDLIPGYYSSVGIVKYTSKPNVYIEGLEKYSPNRHSYNYLGCYSQKILSEEDTKDYTEKVYSYRFVILDKNDNILADTGELLHNNSKDINSYESQDEFSYMMDFDRNQVYYIQYSIITNNGLKISSPKYRLVAQKSIEPDVKTYPVPYLNFDNGYVDIHLDSSNYKKIINEITEEGEIKEREIENPVSGSFILSRKVDNSPWEEVFRFSLINEKLSEWSWKDFTVEQGKIYTYSLQEYNDYRLYSERTISEDIYVDFEDAFLFDGKRQLRIRYNPKITSFKTDHLENKIDTIGSKFPFIFRNGNVGYKEFPISGLISYQMDEENLFGFDEDFVLTENFKREKYQGTPSKQLDEYKVKTTNLVGYNFSAERDFKLEVLDWLNNGQPKLFRSPSEGNYIVRLLNTSFSPEDVLSRMIHTFNSTAYEVAECNYENLNKYNFISLENSKILQTRWITIPLVKKSNIENKDLIEIMQHKQATSVYFYDMQPGEMVYINNKSIVIGATGSYFIDNGEIITSIQIPGGVIYTGAVTYSFEDSSMNTFDTIIDVQMDDVVAHQFIGYYENIIDVVEDLKTKISNFYYLHFQKRDVSKVYPKWTGKGYEKEDGFIILYRDKNATSKISLKNSEKALLERYNNEVEYCEKYYDYKNEANYQRALKNINFDYQEKEFYSLYAPYLADYEDGYLDYDTYMTIAWILVNRYNDFILTIGPQIPGFENEDNTEDFWVDTALYVVQIPDEEIQGYLEQEKEKIIAKSKEKFLYNLERIKNSDTSITTFESPLTLYKYELDEIEVETSFEPQLTIVGYDLVQAHPSLEPGELTEEYFIFPEEMLKDRYYIRENGEYKMVIEYNKEWKYYIKKPFEFYYDPKQPMTILISQDTNNRLNEFVEWQQKEVYTPQNKPGFAIHNTFVVYSTKCWIDDEELDLSDDIDIKINSLYKFNKIKLDAGVVLNCGYELQTVEYFDESEIKIYDVINNLKKILNSSWKNSKDESFIKLVTAVDIDKNLPYNQIIQLAQIKYDAYYDKYIRELTHILKEKEVIE